ARRERRCTAGHRRQAVQRGGAAGPGAGTAHHHLDRRHAVPPRRFAHRMVGARRCRHVRRQAHRAQPHGGDRPVTAARACVFALHRAGRQRLHRRIADSIEAGCRGGRAPVQPMSCPEHAMPASKRVPAALPATPRWQLLSIAALVALACGARAQDARHEWPEGSAMHTLYVETERLEASRATLAGAHAGLLAAFDDAPDDPSPLARLVASQYARWLAYSSTDCELAGMLT